MRAVTFKLVLNPAGRPESQGPSNFIAISMMLFIWACASSSAQAAFEFNFNKHSTGNISMEAEQSCGNFAGLGNSNCSWDSGGGTFDNGTAWRNEIITEAGNQYWHQVVGDNADPFRQEAYIRMGTDWNWQRSGSSALGGTQRFSDAGGYPGDINGGGGAGTNMNNCEKYMGLGCDPLNLHPQAGSVRATLGAADMNRWTGNASGNPTRAVFHTVLTDVAGGFYQEVFKDAENTKQKITQTLDNGGMKSEFQADMRNSTFADMNSPLTVVSAMNSGPGTFVNKLTFTPSINAEYGNNADFDMATLVAPGSAVQGIGGIETGHSRVTAGRYTFTAGLGWKNTGATPNYTATYGAIDPANWPMYDRGVYAFFDGGFDAYALNYGKFMTPAQNPCGGDPFC